MRPALNSPRFWLITLTAVLLAGASFSLGQWQLRRAAQKEALQTAIESRSGLSVLDARALAAARNGNDLLHRQATLAGHWSAAHTIYLDNRPMDGKSGFVVVTPLLLDGSAQVVLVQRGWVPRNFTDRTRLPDISTPMGPVTVHGRIAPAPSRLYQFKNDESGRIRQNLDIPAFRTETVLPLLDVSLLQTGVASEGLLRNWAAPNLGLDKHYGYAFQWFALCSLVLGLYVWFQLILPLRTSTATQHRDQLP
ncbi:SURF1 family protein [Polaromonas sp.]|uniref:SURF1 family protein n=1 Tax=Polaromonas sp. TaxID=1869339 RepID=UPI00185EC280|nr:SURF1 family protein [Polaromonas sp.]NMM08178.1 SURF1 family protein [Polaromonas sp.]